MWRLNADLRWSRTSLLTILGRAGRFFIGHLADVLFGWGSVFSAVSLASALVIAVASLAWTRVRQGRGAPSMKLLIRALFPRRLLKCASTHADFGLFLFNVFPPMILFGWIIVSATQIGGLCAHGLNGLFGERARANIDPGAARAIATLALFLAYEFGYWLDHYLSHKVPFLWEFHKVHHTAEVLSPLTAFRVHPVDTLVFANISSLILGMTAGALDYLFGGSVSPFTLSGSNIVLVAFIFLTVHLQHSHIWISFTGLLGRIFLSPAHHQIHHSADPIHFNRNFGSCLSVWDWAFGTLMVPERQRQRLRFGAELRPGSPSAHSVTGVLIAPFLEALRALISQLRGKSPVRAERAARTKLSQGAASAFSSAHK